MHFNYENRFHIPNFINLILKYGFAQIEQKTQEEYQGYINDLLIAIL